MIETDLQAVIYGLASAASWGAGDFGGGLASKRNHVVVVIIVSQAVGASLLLALALLLGEPLAGGRDLWLGAIAGLLGELGLVALYLALARGRMGVVAPVAAVVSAILPVLVGIAQEGLPTIMQLLGFGLALLAVWLLSRGSNHTPFSWSDLSLPMVAGIGFGLFFILIDRVSQGVILWPLITARLASITALVSYAAIQRQRIIPAANQFPVMVLAGIFDSGGNAFFALATQAGRLDISTIVSSLYPAGTVILAWLILKEKLERQQWLGVLTALLALLLIAV